MTRRQKVWLAISVALTSFLIAAPATAQETGGEAVEAVATAGEILLAIGVFGGITKYAIQMVKRHAPTLSGTWTQLVAIAIGIGLSAVLDFRATSALLEQANLGNVIGREITAALDWIVTGLAIAMASGIIAEVVGTSGPKAAALQAEARASEAVANGNAITEVPLHGDNSHLHS